MTTKVVCVAPAKVRVKDEPVALAPESQPSPNVLNADQIRRKWLKEMTAVISTPTLQSTTA